MRSRSWYEPPGDTICGKLVGNNTLRVPRFQKHGTKLSVRSMKSGCIVRTDFGGLKLPRHETRQGPEESRRGEVLNHLYIPGFGAQTDENG